MTRFAIGWSDVTMYTKAKPYGMDEIYISINNLPLLLLNIFAPFWGTGPPRSTKIIIIIKK